LVKVLLDQTLRDHHHIVLQGMSYIVKHLAQDCVEFLPVIIPPLMILIKSNDQDLIFDLYQCLYAIIASVPASINKFSDIIFETINEVIVTQSIQVLELIKLLNINCKEMLTTDMFLLLPKVLQLVEYKRAHDVQVAIKAVNTIGDFQISILSNYLYIIIPMLLRICSNGVSPDEIKLNIEVLKTIDTLKNCQTFREHMGQIIHSLLQVMETHISQIPYVTQILELITNIAEKLTIDFAPYIPLIQKAIRRNKLTFERFDVQVEIITKINPINLFQ
jgi:serine/threonine-protein kinase mTOR